MKIGDRVRIISSINVYHHPEHRGQAFDIKDLEGEIVHIMEDWHGRTISPNYPIQIKLGNKFKVHLGMNELEALEEVES